MYGMPGGLDGEITLPAKLSGAGYVTQAVGKWHMGENIVSQPQNVGFDDFYGFLSVSASSSTSSFSSRRWPRTGARSASGPTVRP